MTRPAFALEVPSIEAAPIQPLAGLSGTPESLAAAHAGDLAALDRLDLAWLRAWGQAPTPPEEVPVQLLEEHDWELFPLRIVRGGDSRRIEWGYVQRCRHCSGRIAKRCRWCAGIGRDLDVAIWCFETADELRVIPGTLSDDIDPEEAMEDAW
jgi:hypothetical protein